MAIFRVRYIKPDGAETERLLEADWQTHVEQELVSRGCQLLSIQQVHTSTSPGVTRSRRNATTEGGFWTFRRFVTPSWVCFVFGSNVVLVALLATYAIYEDINALVNGSRFGSSDIVHIAGIVVAIIGAFLYLFVVRIALEGMVVLFRIYDELRAIRRDLQERPRI